MAEQRRAGTRAGWLRRLVTQRPIRLLLLAAWALLLPLALMVACQAAPAAANLGTEVRVASDQAADSTTMTLAQWQAQRTNNALFFALLVAVATLIAFVGIWRTVGTRDPLEARMAEYGMDGSSAFLQEPRPTTGLRSLSTLKRLANGLGVGPVLAEQLAQADVPLTASEFALLTIAAALLGILIGMWRFGFLLGSVLGAVLGYLPFLYLKMTLSRRRRQFTEQLPDVLMLLVGALRAGYGLTQSLQVLVEQLPDPASKEFARVVNSVSLGVSIQQALSELSERVQTDDIGLIVTAINVQYEVGGNLAETLNTIGETIRDRIRIKGEIMALTAEEQLTGYVLVALPVILGLVLFTMNPGYMSGMFAPGPFRLLPVVALMLQFFGYLAIRKIIDIEV